MWLPSSEDTISKLFKSQWQKIFFYGGQVTHLEWTKREGPSIPRAHVRTHGLTAPQTVFPTKLAITSCHILSWLLCSFCNTKSSAHKQWSVRSTKGTQQMLEGAPPSLPMPVPSAKQKVKILHQCKYFTCNTPWRRFWCVLKQHAYGVSILQPRWAASLSCQTSPRVLESVF